MVSSNSRRLALIVFSVLLRGAHRERPDRAASTSSARRPRCCTHQGEPASSALTWWRATAW